MGGFDTSTGLFRLPLLQPRDEIAEQAAQHLAGGQAAVLGRGGQGGHLPARHQQGNFHHLSVGRDRTGFVARQMRISTETSHFYLDLVFYNYLLKCFVVIDLKTDKLAHQDIGQMDMYVRMFEDLRKVPGDNPTIGIILCTEKDATLVKYSVLEENRQLFASSYQLLLPTEEELMREINQAKYFSKRT